MAWCVRRSSRCGSCRWSDRLRSAGGSSQARLWAIAKRLPEPPDVHPKARPKARPSAWRARSPRLRENDRCRGAGRSGACRLSGQRVLFGNVAVCLRSDQRIVDASLDVGAADERTAYANRGRQARGVRCSRCKRVRRYLRRVLQPPLLAPQSPSEGLAAAARRAGRTGGGRYGRCKTRSGYRRSALQVLQSGSRGRGR